MEREGEQDRELVPKFNCKNAWDLLYSSCVSTEQCKGKRYDTSQFVSKPSQNKGLDNYFVWWV